MTTGCVYDPIFLEHDLPGHPENSRRLRVIMEALDEAGLLPALTQVPAQPVALELLHRVHTPLYCQYVERVAQRGGGFLDADTYVAPRSYEAALMAAGGLVEAVRAVLEGRLDNAFALVRPPGHHARPAHGMGFCLFNNIAVAAVYALEQAGLERVLIVDFDVHHGNGTQEVFYEDDRVLYFSTHQYPFYPGTGHWQEIGEGRGQGYTVNVPLPYGVGDEGFRCIFVELLFPLARRFRPQLILVSAGYDAHWRDPLAGLSLSLKGYAQLAELLRMMAGELCGGRLVFTLEGGYDLEVLAYGAANAFRVLMGVPAEECPDPFGPASGLETPINGFVRQLRTYHRLS
ncbi:MAG: histone deacetylase family protein [Anaerolineae bacterium]